jgi:hypothetical protein
MPENRIYRDTGNLGGHNSYFLNHKLLFANCGRLVEDAGHPGGFAPGESGQGAFLMKRD